MRKMASIAVAMVLVLAIFLPIVPTMTTWAAVDTKAIDLNIQVLGRPDADEITPEGYRVYKFYSGEPIRMRASFKASGTDVDLPFGSIKITFPQAGKDLVEGFNFVDSRLAKETIHTQDPNGEYSVRYQFNEISGGDVGAYPFSFNFKNQLTPNGERQLVKLQVLDEEGNVVLGKELTIVLEAMAGSNYTGDKWYHGGDVLMGRFESEASRQQETPEDPQRTKVTFTNGFTANAFPNAGSGRGEFTQGILRVVETIPEGAVLTDHPTNKDWVQSADNPRVYTQDKPAKDLPRDHEGRLLMPMVLSFPNQPYKNKNGSSYYTDRFVNSSEFFYDDGTGMKKVGAGKANVAFFISPPPPAPNGEFKVTKYSNQGDQLYSSRHNPLLVNVAADPQDITAVWQPDKNNPHSVVKMWPQDEDAYKAFRWTTELWSNKRPDRQKVLEETGETILQPGVAQHTDYVQGFVHYKELLGGDKGLANGNAGFYFKEFTLNPARVSSLPGYEEESAKVSTAQWINENIKYDLYLTRVNSWSSGLDGKDAVKTLGFRTDWNNNNEVKAPVSSVLPEESKLVKSGIKVGETVQIEDEAGYYNALAVVFSNPELHNTRPDGVEVNALPLRNAYMSMTTTSWAVKAGGKTITKDGSTVVSTDDDDYYNRFSELVLDKLAKGDRTGARDTKWNIMEHLTVSSSSPTGDTVPNNVTEGASPLFPVGDRIGRRDEEGNREIFWENNSLTSVPNFGKLGLTSSTDTTLNYSQNPESMRHLATFKAELSKDTIAAADTMRIKNMKGVVLLPAGVFFHRSVDRGGAIAEPLVVDNYHNTGRQAIVYDFGDYRERTTGTIKYELQVTGDAKDSTTGDGKNLVDTWVTWDNNDTILAQEGMGNTQDELSMNANGRLNDEILHRQYNITVNLPQEVFITKYVANPDTENNGAAIDLTDPESFNWTAYSRLNDIDSDFYYQVRVVNKYVEAIETATVVDAVPTRGDYKTVANEAGDYALRGPDQTGSVFATPLTGPIEEVAGNDKANEKFKFTYSTAPIVKENPNIVPVDSWKTAAQITAGETDPQAIREAWKKVTAWRAVLREGQNIPGLPDEHSSAEAKANFKPGDNEVAIFFKARVENNKDIPVDSLAYNSVAYMLHGAKKLQEGNEVQVSNVRYVIDGHTFRDIKMDGNLSNNRIPGLTAQLVYASAGVDSMGRGYVAGDPVPSEWFDVATRDPETGLLTPIADAAQAKQALTDGDGYYAFIAYKRGDYAVQFTRPDDSPYQFVQCGVSDGVTRSNVNKTWNGVFSAKDTAVSTDLTVNPTDLHYSEKSELLTEKGSLHAIRNAALHDSRQDLVIKKVGLDKDGQETGTLAGTEFILYHRTGDDQGEQIATVTTDNEGMATIKDISAGDYYLVEQIATEGYKKPVRVKVTYTPPTDCNSKGRFTFEKSAEDTKESQRLFVFDEETGITTVQNNPILGSIEIVKKANGEDGNYADELQSGVVFGLYRFGKPVMDNSGSGQSKPLTATTGADGVARFENIAGGEYTIKELKPAVGYTAIDNKNTADTADDVNLETEGFKVTVPANPEPTAVNQVSVTVGNKPVTGKIRVVKHDDDGHPLAGATFGLFRKTDKDQKAPAEDAKPAYEAVTAEKSADSSATPEGQILFTEVPYGEWFVKEISAPKGYTKSEKVTLVSIRLQGQTQNATPNSAFVNSIVKRDVKIKKTDADTHEVLSDASFALYPCTGELDIATNLRECGDHVDQNQVAKYTATTDEHGVATFAQVEYGNYLLKETQAPDGYVTSQTVKKITVPEKVNPATAAGKTDTDLLDLTKNPETNVRIKGNVTLKKVDSIDNSRHLEGVTFALFVKDAPDNVFTFAGKRFSATTNAEGALTFTGIPAGTYLLKETATIKGYTLSDDTREFSIATDGQSINYTVANADHPEQGWFTNQPKLHELTVTKVDGETNKPLSGAKFKVFPARQDGKNWVKASETPIGEERTTADDGTVHFADLRMGHYLLEETQPPLGYSGSDPIHFEADGEHLAIKKTVENSMVLRDIVFTKVDQGGLDAEPKQYKPLSGVVFDIYAATLNGEKYEKTGKSLQQITTGADGRVRFRNMKAGHYIIEETTAATGYLRATDTISVQVVPGEGDIVATADGYFGNTLITGAIKVTKTGETPEGGSTPVAGVSFELRAGETVVATGQTDSEGILTFADIQYGDYTLVETSAPQQYVVETESQNVEIRENDVTVENTFHNKLKKGTLRITKRAAEGDHPALAGAVFELKQGDVVKYTLPATNQDGNAQLADIPYGIYTLVEKTAPEGYQLSEATVEVNINTNGQQIEKTIDDAAITGNIVIKKLGTVDATDTTTQNLSGATFELTPVTNEGLTLGHSVTVLSDEQGLVTFENVPYGTYVISEKVGVPGYNTTDKTVKVKISEQGVTYGYTEEANASQDYVFTNTIIRNDVRVMKIDGATNQPLAGAHLGLFRCIPAGGAVCDQLEEKPAYEVVTTEDGIAVISDVLYGAYKLREIASPEGYLLSDVVTDVIVEEQKNAEGNNIIAADPVENTRIRGSVEFFKANADNEKMFIEGTHFSLVPVTADGAELDEATRNAFDIDENAGANYTAVSDSEGHVQFNNVAAGTYRLVEEQAAIGYVQPEQAEIDTLLATLNNGSELIRVSENGKTITLGSAEQPLTNEPIKGSIVFHKVIAGCDVPVADNNRLHPDTETALALSTEMTANCKMLPGARFQLRPVVDAGMETPFTDVEAYTFEATSSSDYVNPGAVVFENVPYGTYELVELQAPSGFVTSTEIIRVIISEKGAQVLEPFENKRVPVVKSPLAATGVTALTLIAAASSLALFALGVIFLRRKETR